MKVDLFLISFILKKIDGLLNKLLIAVHFISKQPFNIIKLSEFTKW